MTLSNFDFRTQSGGGGWMRNVALMATVARPVGLSPCLSLTWSAGSWSRPTSCKSSSRWSQWKGICFYFKTRTCQGFDVKGQRANISALKSGSGGLLQLLSSTIYLIRKAAADSQECCAWCVNETTYKWAGFHSVFHLCSTVISDAWYSLPAPRASHAQLVGGLLFCY